jgi:hypothetical protein
MAKSAGLGILTLMFELVWSSSGAERRVELAPGRGYRIGRDPACEIAVEDPFVSAEHAEARLVGTDLQVRRTKSLNPLVVNGRFLDEVLLKSGESLPPLNGRISASGPLSRPYPPLIAAPRGSGNQTPLRRPEAMRRISRHDAGP